MKSILAGNTSQLNGDVHIQGGKNAVLPMLAAAILTDEKVKINNCPDIEDVRQTAALLEMLGCRVFFAENTVEIYPENIIDAKISDRYTKNTRSSINFLGAVLARKKKVTITAPGGCKIGVRPYDLHIENIRKLNVKIQEINGDIEASAEELKGAEIRLTFPSVGATENLLLAAVTAKGITVIKNAAMEPEVAELAAFLCSMGGNIKGAGTDTIVIEGAERLHGTEFTVGGDRIVAATYMAAAAICGGKVKLSGINPAYMLSTIEIFKLTGMKIKCRGNVICCKMKGKIKNVAYIQTMPYPGIPTDIQPLLAAVMVFGDGVSRIRENVFENRFLYALQLKKMGADIELKKDNSVIIYGKKEIRGAVVKAEDLRGGAALVIASLGALGNSRIENTGYIDRGYENIVRDLRMLGADIREDNELEKEREEK